MKEGDRNALRCAIYTRVSTEHGLEQEFNSLHNQREAAEAYVKSQAHEGWRCSRERYDDGGFSGGSMDRPALQRLLEAISSRLIDVVVVYKVDRLTRSLTDFAKLVELFDEHGVSFVSVTQAFNTTTSMGRLTLNVLLSFAQFEREVTGERIRDKIAASKRKGLRVGGPVPLGYGVRDKKLVVDEAEAETVRTIFARYLALGSLNDLVVDLRATGFVTKVTAKRDGTVRGGIPFTKGPLAYLLRNRVYVGELIHKGRYHPGEHQPILGEELFEAVQHALTSKAGHGRVSLAQASCLSGFLVDDRGHPMLATSAKKNGARYRYYVSAPLTRGRKEDAGSVARVPAPEIEAAVLSALGIDPGEIAPGRDGANSVLSGALGSRVDRIVVKPGAIEIWPREHDSAPVLLPWSVPPVRRRREVLCSDDHSCPQPIRAETRARLVEGIAKARAWMDELVSSRIKDTAEIAARERISERSVRMTLNLAFLSPALVKAALDGTLLNGLGTTALAEAPMTWSEQERLRLG